MPRERLDLTRISDVKEPEKLFLLAYEGNETEPTYFEALKKDYRFESDIIEIISLKRDKGDTRSSPNHVYAVLQNVKEEYNLGERDELWMIIDRDKNGKNIEKFYQKCLSEKNFYFSLSNPCFELWLLLHIKDMSEFTTDEQQKILDNKKITKRVKRTYLKKLLSGILADGYNESNLRPERFLPTIEIAMQRAKGLNKPEDNYPSGLGTDIYKLIEKLINQKSPFE